MHTRPNSRSAGPTGLCSGCLLWHPAGGLPAQEHEPELPPLARLGPVLSGLHRLPQKGTQIPNHFRPPLRKPGKWHATHEAYMILKHQEKMKGDPYKLDFQNNLLPCLPWLDGALHPGQELSHPATSLFTAAGAIYSAANPFTAAPRAQGSFLSPSTHIDPFGHPTSFASLAALTGPLEAWAASHSTPASSLPRKKAQGLHQPSPPCQTHGATCTTVLWPFLLGSGPLRPPGHQAHTRISLWSRESLLSPRRRKTGTSPSQGPSSEFLLLLPRPGLARKGPGRQGIGAGKGRTEGGVRRYHHRVSGPSPAV